MRIVLPPSETKRPGGTGPALDTGGLAFPELSARRQQLIEELTELSSDTDRAVRALKLGPKGAALIAANRELTTSPTTKAIERYTGVLFDALDYDSLDPADKSRANEVLWVFSALFGPIRATDMIPNYRLSADSALPGGKLSKRWSGDANTVWAGGFTIDLRSEAYRGLCPLIPGTGVFVRVVTDTGSGKSAVGHANKATKGHLVRDLVTSGVELFSRDDLVGWGSAHGYDFQAVADNADEVFLVVR